MPINRSHLADEEHLDAHQAHLLHDLRCPRPQGRGLAQLPRLQDDVRAGERQPPHARESGGHLEDMKGGRMDSICMGAWVYGPLRYIVDGSGMVMVYKSYSEDQMTSHV